MLNKKTSLKKAALLLAASILFTACDNEQPTDIVIGEHTEATGSLTSQIPDDVTAAVTSSLPAKTDEPVSEPAPIIRTEASEMSEKTEAPEMSEKDELKAALEILPYDSFPAPDGSTVRKEEAIEGTVISKSAALLVYDGAYIRYAPPIYIDTDSDPSLYDFSSDKWNGDILDEPREITGECFKVKKGDVLENGLKVIEARSIKEADLYFPQYKFNEFYASEIVFEGSLTLEGVLYCMPETEYGVSNENEVLFFPDPTKNGFIPCMVTNAAEDKINKTLIDGSKRFADKNNEFAFISGINPRSAFSLGDLSKIAFLSGKLSKGECLKATVTITDISIRLSNQYSGHRARAKAVIIQEMPH